MALTEEQKERMRQNREKALEIQRRRKEEEEKKKKRSSPGVKEGGVSSDSNKRLKLSIFKEEEEESGNKKKKKKDNEQIEDRDIVLEDFEVGASDYVTKKDAKNLYCLPEGTLAVCEVVEKPNPHNPKFKPMKLYRRSQIRRFARERFDGLEGLAAERTKRQQKKYEKDMEQTMNVLR